MAELRLVLRREGCRLDHQTSSLFRPLAAIPVLECRGGNRGERCAAASSGRAEHLILQHPRRRSERSRFSVRGSERKGMVLVREGEMQEGREGEGRTGRKDVGKEGGLQEGRPGREGGQGARASGGRADRRLGDG